MQKVLKVEEIISPDKHRYDFLSVVANKYLLPQDTEEDEYQPMIRWIFFMFLYQLYKNANIIYFHRPSTIISSKFTPSCWLEMSIKSRIRMFYDNLNNIFYNEEMKMQLEILFSKMQRTYNGFLRLLRLYRYKHAPIRVNMDLGWNIIDTKKNHMAIIQENHIYLFTFADLFKIITSNLLNLFYFDLQPKKSKNPYNNLFFSNAILYAIYFKCIQHNIAMPILFKFYYDANFNIKTLIVNHNSYMHELALKHHVKNASMSELQNSAQEMLKKYSKIVVHDKFPVKEVITAMRPFLELFYIVKYGMYNKRKQLWAKSELKNRLQEFSYENTHFGRIFMKAHI